MDSIGSSSISPRLDEPLTIIMALKHDAARAWRLNWQQERQVVSLIPMTTLSPFLSTPSSGTIYRRSLR
jgi:hypothetical protein